jgi:NTP pyrophosphatase (non-canonical NTP hydrolase)
MKSGWENLVIQWAAERKIFSGSTPDRQLEKLQEEVGELFDAVDDADLEAVKDAIGDCAVVLAIVANMYGMDFTDCQEAAWEQIKDRKGEMRNGVFVKEADL